MSNKHSKWSAWQNVDKQTFTTKEQSKVKPTEETLTPIAEATPTPEEHTPPRIGMELEEITSTANVKLPKKLIKKDEL